MMRDYSKLSHEEKRALGLKALAVCLPRSQAETKRAIRRDLGLKATGRAPVADAERRDHKVFVRLNDAELEPLFRWADARGLSLAAAVRTLALTAVATNDGETNR